MPRRSNQTSEPRTYKQRLHRLDNENRHKRRRAFDEALDNAGRGLPFAEIVRPLERAAQEGALPRHELRGLTIPRRQLPAVGRMIAEEHERRQRQIAEWHQPTSIKSYLAKAQIVSPATARAAHRRGLGHERREATNTPTRGSRRASSSHRLSSDRGDPDPPSTPSSEAAADPRICPGAYPEARAACGTPLRKPKRGPWPNLCDDCKREKDADRKRESRREARREREAYKTLPSRKTHLKAGRVRGRYRNAAGKELHWDGTRAPDVGVARFIAAYGGRSTYDGGVVRPGWYLHPPDCRKSAESWDRLRTHYFTENPAAARSYRELREQLAGKSLEEQAAILEARATTRAKVTELQPRQADAATELGEAA